jgi:hypothetical protein
VNAKDAIPYEGTREMRYLIVGLALSVTAIMGAQAVRADDPVLTKVIFFSHTNDDNKDHDTGVYVKVWTSDVKTVIAHANNRDNSGDDGTEYKSP